MNSLAMAMHAEMDATSPAHRDANGDPLVWDLWAGPDAWRKHGAVESGQPSARTRREMDIKLKAMYDKVMAPPKVNP